jgi:transcriptional regulator GlxA family with amidase domain
MRCCDSAQIFRPKRIGLIGFDQVAAAHLIETANIFTTAALHDGFGGRIPCYELRTLGVLSERFQAECGRRRRAELNLRTAPPLDTIIIAGGKGILDERIINVLTVWLQERANETRRMGAICTGVYALAAAGLLDGREVTTDWGFAPDLAARFPRVTVDPERSLIHDGPYYSCSGASAATALSLAIIKEDYGLHVARAVCVDVVRHALTIKKPMVGAHPAEFADHQRDRLADVVSWMIRNLHDDLSVHTLARRAGMAPGYFSKTFKTVFGAPPMEFVRNLRLNEARRRLARCNKTLRTVAASVGFTDQDAFRRAFARRFGETPGNVLAKSSQKRRPTRSPAKIVKFVESNCHEVGIAAGG